MATQLPECEHGTRIPHEPRMCSLAEGQKCRDLIEDEECPRETAKDIMAELVPDEPAVPDAPLSKNTVFVVGKVVKDPSDQHLIIDSSRVFDAEKLEKAIKDVPPGSTIQVIDMSISPKWLSRKICGTCGWIGDVPPAQKRCKGCGIQSLTRLEKIPEPITGTKYGIRPAYNPDHDFLPCGHMIRTHELTVDDTETRQVFIRYLCMQGHLTEWQYVGEVPSIDKCEME